MIETKPDDRAPQYEDQLLDPATDLGFAQVNGQGRKVALAVLGKGR